jgi:hypothetical protein
MDTWIKGWNVNTTDKYIIEEVERFKKKWLKSDVKKLKELELNRDKMREEKEKAWKNYLKLQIKEMATQKQIDLIEKKYTYVKKTKVKNPNYQDPIYGI